MTRLDSDTRADDSFGLVGRTIDAKYRVDRIAARGGFGVVYAGHHVALDVPIAIKILKPPPGLDAEATRAYAERFLGEARTVARLRHPNIVQVLDAGVTVVDGASDAKPLPWIVFEWLEGETLADWLDGLAGRRLTRAECLALLRPVFEALAYAHASSVAHRDVKPANVLLVATPRGPSPRVVDFGIAKPMSRDGSADTAQTGSSQANFTPGYVAPEQLAGMRTGPWTDVHALGLIVTEALAGGPAYPEASLAEVYSAALDRNQRPTPARLGVDAGPWESVLARATAFAPEERYADAGAMLAALEATVGEAAAAPPVSTPRRARASDPRLRASTTASVVANSGQVEFVRRRARTARIAVTACGVLLVALVVALVRPSGVADPARGARSRLAQPVGTGAARAPAPTPPLVAAPVPVAAPPLEIARAAASTPATDPAPGRRAPRAGASDRRRARPGTPSTRRNYTVD